MYSILYTFYVLFLDGSVAFYQIIENSMWIVDKVRNFVVVLWILKFSIVSLIFFQNLPKLIAHSEKYIFLEFSINFYEFLLIFLVPYIYIRKTIVLEGMTTLCGPVMESILSIFFLTFFADIVTFVLLDEVHRLLPFHKYSFRQNYCFISGDNRLLNQF